MFLTLLDFNKFFFLLFSFYAFQLFVDASFSRCPMTWKKFSSLSLHFLFMMNIFFPSYIVFWDTFCLKSRHSRRQNKRRIKDRRRKKKVFHHIFFGNHVLVTQRDKDTRINKRGIDLNFKRSNPNDECPWKIMMMGKLSCHIRAIKKAHEENLHLLNE